MPIVGYKKKFKNVEGIKNNKFIVNFKLRYSNNGALELENNDGCGFDVGDYNIILDRVFDGFNNEILNDYDNGVYILSICKYIIDNVPNVYSIVYEGNGMIDTYYKDEIINDYNKINNR